MEKMIYAIFDFIPGEIIIFIILAFLVPYLILFGCWFFIISFQGLAPRRLWCWMLQEDDMEQLTAEIKKYRESKACRPFLVGLLCGIYLSIFFWLNFIVLKQAPPTFGLLSKVILNAGLMVGIVVIWLHLRKSDEF